MEDAATVNVDDSITSVMAVVIILVNNGLAISVLVTAGVINPELLTVTVIVNVVVVVVVVVVGVSSVVKEAVSLNALLVVISKGAVDVGSVHDVVSFH